MKLGSVVIRLGLTTNSTLPVTGRVVVVYVSIILSFAPMVVYLGDDWGYHLSHSPCFLPFVVLS